MRDNSVFVSHGPCERCGSRDNMATYTDGHAYCFGCGYYKSPARSLGNLENRLHPKEPTMENEVALPDGLVKLAGWPDKPRKWVFGYGITPTEVERLGMAYRPLSEELLLPMRDRLGVLVAYQCRNFGPKGPKYRTTGKPSLAAPFGGPWAWAGEDPNTVVFVEDILSAIKVARVAWAVAICGSVPPLTRMAEAIDDGKRVVLWLDPDKVVQAYSGIQELKSWYSKAIPADVIRSNKDPKEYDAQEIYRRLYGAEEWLIQ